MTECIYQGGDCHNFEPRYHSIWPDNLDSKDIKNIVWETPNEIERSQDKIYVHDVCTRCGEITKGINNGQDSK